MTSIPQYTIIHDPDIDFLYITGPRGEHVAVIAGPLTLEDHWHAVVMVDALNAAMVRAGVTA